MMVFTSPGVTVDGVYRPILRPRRGEFTALHHLDIEAAKQVTPIVELRGEDLPRLVKELPPRTGALAVDLDPFMPSPVELALRLDDLGVAMLPVLRAYDTDRRLSENGLAARVRLHRAILRLQPHVDAPNPAAATATTDRLLCGAGMDHECVDLIVDLAETACGSDVDRFVEQARHVLRWAHARPWRSITIAAGAMPPNLDDLPADRPVAVRRLDARVWASLAEPGVGYADYGVTSPVRRLGVQHHRQLPTLRYTTDQAWWIYRWARRGGRSDDRCQDLCQTLVRSPHWPAQGARFSWGDAQIAQRARTARGAGSSASWIGWSTSHHIAHVLNTLTRTKARESIVRMY
ncbi:beta family protein [Krasilnikovia sp. MM14-A1259]|uniref:beta family protein n=1 Tax=Krasilnikovia sp. MM14-A1259 TaxID=3373539 RepID=UPI00399C8FD2